MIYFICDPERQSEVKIGYTKDIKSRLATLRTSSPMDLRVIATMEGDKDTEADIHVDMREHRVNREWFEHGPSIDLITELYLGGFDIEIKDNKYLIYRMTKIINRLKERNALLEKGSEPEEGTSKMYIAPRQRAVAISLFD